MDAKTAAEIAALPSMQALPLKRRFFALAYVRSQNGSEAVREAGYKQDRSPASKGGQVSSTAGRLLRDPSVAAAVREGLDLKWRAIAMGPDELIARASRIARHDHRRVIDAITSGGASALATIDDDTAEALGGVKIRVEKDKHGAVKAETVEIKQASKIAAIELLAKYHRLLQADVSADDFGVCFAQAMERAARRASMRDAAEQADDAVVVERSAVASGAGDAFADGVAPDGVAPANGETT